MALIETTDDFFTTATKELNHGPLEEHNIVALLDSLYLSFTGNNSHTQKSSIIIWDEYEHIVSSELIENIQTQLINNNNYKYLSDTIKNKYSQNALYQQGIVLFLYWMLLNRKRRLLSDWPLPLEMLNPLATDLGITIYDD